MCKSFDIIYDEKTGTWVEKKEPYITIEVETEEDYKFLVERLEKQKAKRPVKSETQDMRYLTIYSCPVCGKGIMGTNIAKFCFHCGQKLDWSDDEE